MPAKPILIDDVRLVTPTGYGRPFFDKHRVSAHARIRRQAELIPLHAKRLEHRLFIIRSKTLVSHFRPSVLNV